MGLRELLGKIKSSRPERSDQDLASASLSLGVSDKYHARFVSEFTSLIDEITDAGEFLTSRRMRNKVEELRTAVQGIMARSYTYPEAIFDARDLKVALRLIPQMLTDYAEYYIPGDKSEIPELVQARQNIFDVIESAKQIERDMSRGTVENLDAHNQTIARIIQRYASVSPTLDKKLMESSHA